MHGNEHGNTMLCIKCTVRVIRDHEKELGLHADTLVKRMKDRLHGLCSSPFIQQSPCLPSATRRSWRDGTRSTRK